MTTIVPDKWMKSGEPPHLDAGDSLSAAPFADNSVEAITARTLRDFAYELEESLVTSPLVGPEGPPGPTGPAGPIGPTGPAGEINVLQLTQAEFDAIPVKDPDTIYVITDATSSVLDRIALLEAQVAALMNNEP